MSVTYSDDFLRCLIVNCDHSKKLNFVLYCTLIRFFPQKWCDRHAYWSYTIWQESRQADETTTSVSNISLIAMNYQTLCNSAFTQCRGQSRLPLSMPSSIHCTNMTTVYKILLCMDNKVAVNVANTGFFPLLL